MALKHNKLSLKKYLQLLNKETTSKLNLLMLRIIQTEEHKTSNTVICVMFSQTKGYIHFIDK